MRHSARPPGLIFVLEFFLHSLKETDDTEALEAAVGQSFVKVCESIADRYQ